MKKRVRPDVIFTHHGADLHQDHRMTSELTWNTFRDHVILEYEIPKYDGGLGGPNVFVPVTEQQRDCKVDRLLECFVSERGKAWFTRETFLGLMRLRGIECNAPGGYAEAFHCRKLVWSVDGLRGS
jgi:LmbE family N-acetylglucosaminyl deacetylase